MYRLRITQVSRLLSRSVSDHSLRILYGEIRTRRKQGGEDFNFTIFSREMIDRVRRSTRVDAERFKDERGKGGNKIYSDNEQHRYKACVRAVRKACGARGPVRNGIPP